MRFERIGKNAVKISLSPGETKEQDFSRKKPGLTGREGAAMGIAEKIICSPAAKSLTVSFPCRISAEVIPGRDGGISVYLCTENTSPLPLDRYLITVSDIKSLVRVCTELSLAGLSFQDCALFADSTCAKLTARLPGENSSLTERLREYACLLPLSEHILTALSEHSSPIFERNAVARVLEIF